jgi:hypothetical protein
LRGRRPLVSRVCTERAVLIMKQVEKQDDDLLQRLKKQVERR